MLLQLSVPDAIAVLLPLLVFVLGMVVYSVFIFKFYRFVATRDIIPLNLQQYQRYTRFEWLKQVLNGLFYIAEYIIIFPLLLFFWFAVFAVFLLLLSQQSPTIVLLIAMAIVATVRVAAYYSEDLAKDVAKTIPFSLLAIFLIDLHSFQFGNFPFVLQSISGLWDTLVYYGIFVLLLELLLRVLTLLFGLRNGGEDIVLEG